MNDYMGEAMWYSVMTGKPLFFYCGNCDTELPKEDWEITQEDSAVVSHTECPECDEYMEIRVG